VIKGIAEGCEQSGCALVGGETAEMPGMYPAGEYDLAGFAVGCVDKEKIINGLSITAGDVVLGLASSGAHSNGYSLIRKLIAKSGIDFESDFHGRKFKDSEKSVFLNFLYLIEISCICGSQSYTFCFSKLQLVDKTFRQACARVCEDCRCSYTVKRDLWNRYIFRCSETGRTRLHSYLQRC
jgi:hypothetical protein